MALRRALPGTVVPWSPDFPRRSKLRRGRPALWHRPYALLRSRQQQSEQLGAAFAVDDAVDQVGTEPALESDHRFLLVGHVVTEAFERQEEPGVRPIRVDEVARGAGQSQPALGERVPGKELARVLLARRSDVGVADYVAAADAVALLDVSDQWNDRRHLLVGKLAIAKLV